MTELIRPAGKPARPYFSSGPCAKPPGWSPEKLNTDVLGRSHRSKLGKQRLRRAVRQTESTANPEPRGNWLDLLVLR